MWGDFDKIKKKGLFVNENQFSQKIVLVFKLIILLPAFLTFE